MPTGKLPYLQPNQSEKDKGEQKSRNKREIFGLISKVILNESWIMLRPM